MNEDNIVKTINTVEYIVLLTNGKVTTHLSTHPRQEGPYRYCRNLAEADLYSLNILRQNVAEREYKTGKIPDVMTREFLGHNQTIETTKILPTMKWIQSTFPEKFV